MIHPRAGINVLEPRRVAPKADLRTDIGTFVIQYKEVPKRILLLALLVVLLFFATGFAVHLLWVVAVIFLVIWFAGFLLGRGGNGRHHFYNW